MHITGPVVALAGNPNCGKTSLFNYITGSRQHVGNYPGVTVEKKEGIARVDNTQVTFIDLPGTYSLSPFTLEEKVAMREIVSERIDGIIIVVDTTRLIRNLYFASQVFETGKPVVLALNMYDEFESSGSALDIEKLSDILGVPCVKTVGNRGKGVTELMATALKAVRGDIPAYGRTPHYDHETEHAIDDVMDIIDDKVSVNKRWAAVNLLHYGRSFPDNSLHGNLTNGDYEKILSIQHSLQSLDGLEINSIITSGRYGFATGAIKECLTDETPAEFDTSERIDRIVTNKWLGIPIFLIVLWAMFQATFTLGEIPMAWIESLFALLAEGAASIIPESFVQSLVVDGIIAGVGGVVVFLPNILILFFFISILEDTGYMARAAFIMDRVMHICGLHGKSFIPMLVGFGCTVPAIMATRTLESRRDRYITMFIIPFMSCGARLPVYILLAGAFFGPKHAGNVIFSIYIVGVILAFLIAKTVSVFNKSTTSFVMELPPYRIPTLRSVLLHIWERAWMYLRKAGTVILMFSMIMWFLMSYPKLPETTDSGVPAKPSAAASLSYSFAGRFGRLIEPALKPLGFDWRTGVALTAGFAAKEVVVSTFATIYSIGDNSTHDLKTALRNDPNLNPVKAYGLMLFILIYIPCVAVLGILRREAGGWRWVILMVVYTTSVAWFVSFTFITIATALT